MLLCIKDLGNVAVDVIIFGSVFVELYTKRMFELLQSAYSTISIQDAAQFLGMSEEDASNCKRAHCLLCLCGEVSY